MSKILYVASTYKHLKNFHLDYIEALKNAGHTVLTMANGEGADFDVPFEKKIFSSENRKCREEIRGILSRENFDVIILNTTLAAFHVRLAIPKKHRPRVINFVHGYLFSKDTSNLRRIAYRLCEKMLAKRTDAIIVMNNEDEQIAKRHKLTRGKVYSTLGMGIKKKTPAKTREEVRGELCRAEDFVLIYVAELSARKNQRFLISAHQKLLSHIPNLKLWRVGEGEEREVLEYLTKSLGVMGSVRFLGAQDSPENFIAASDLYVAPAVSEGLPFNVGEAMALGKTVLASRIKGHVDLIEDGVSGILYTPNSEEEYISLVKKVHSGKISLSKNKIEERFDKFSYDNVFKETLSVIFEAISYERE